MIATGDVRRLFWDAKVEGVVQEGEVFCHDCLDDIDGRSVGIFTSHQLKALSALLEHWERTGETCKKFSGWKKMKEISPEMSLLVFCCEKRTKNK